MGGHDALENTSAWGTLPSTGRCDGVALGWKPPGLALGSGVSGTRAEPAWDQCSKGKASRAARLPGAPNPG